MSLGEVGSASTARLREVRLHLELIRELSPARPGPVRVGVKIAKGMFFVHLYSVLEFTLVASVQKSIQLINARSHRISDAKPVFLSLALDAECRAVASVGPTKMWPKRRVLFARARSSELILINDSILPSDGSNIKYEQLESIWETFCIDTPVLPRLPLRTRLHEITDNRNAVSHGRESPAAVGGRYSVSDLASIFAEVDELCSHIVQTFEGHIANEGFLA
jgi:hypothetical protein